MTFNNVPYGRVQYIDIVVDGIGLDSDYCHQCMFEFMTGILNFSFFHVADLRAYSLNTKGEWDIFGSKQQQ